MAEKSHWSAEPSSYRMSREHDDIWALIYDPTPGGRKNDDGTTTYSMRFPALVLSEYVEGPGKVAAGLARSLNSHDKLVEALRQMVVNSEADGKSYRDCHKKAVAALASLDQESGQ